VIIIHTGRHSIILQLDQPWDEVLELVFDILAFLKGKTSTGWMQHRMEPHIVMFYERINASQAGFERWKNVC